MTSPFTPVDAHIAHADRVTAQTGEAHVVYVQEGEDRWGRDNVFYVRRADDPRPPSYSRTVYRSEVKR